MKFIIDLKPYPAAPYFTVQEHARNYSGNVNSSDLIRNIENILRAFTGLPLDYHFSIIESSKRDGYVAGFNSVLKKDDPISGMGHFKGMVHDLSANNLLDLSYSIPHINGPFDGFDTIIIDPNLSLGIPVGLIVIFSKKDPENRDSHIDMESNKVSGKDLYLFSCVLNDLNRKGQDVLIRESNYKAAVLDQLIDSNDNFKAVTHRENRSKTMVVSEVSEESIYKMYQMGYEVLVHNKNGNSKITIANYPTHSKELIEMFVDRVNTI